MDRVRADRADALSPEPSALVVADLAKSYRALRAVDGVSFDVGAGEIVGLLGVNGVGKSTAIAAILGLTEPDRGAITICGTDARRDRAAAKALVGAALQATSLQPLITPREALAVFGACYPNPQNSEALLARFGLSDKADARFDTLSGGQQQRLALALALVGDPAVVVLDEPTAGLDPSIRRDVHAIIEGIRDDGRAVLIATHDMAEAERLCDRLYVIDAGRVIAKGTPAELIASTVRAQVVVALTEPLIVPVLSGIVTGRTLRFPLGDLNAQLPELVAALGTNTILDIQVERATLEDVVVALVRREAR